MEIVDLRLGADDNALLAAADGAHKIGVDSPLGWPDAFVDFVRAHHEGHVAPPLESGLAWRRTLSRRATDVDVTTRTGLFPLSVSADRIAAVAMRAAMLQAELGRRGHAVDRDGSGLVVEVYPAASLKSWGLTHRRYKRATNVEALDGLVTNTARALPELRWGEFESLSRSSDDAFDAVVCALVARAAALGHTAPSPPELRAVALREGWIALPDVPLRELVGPRRG